MEVNTRITHTAKYVPAQRVSNNQLSSIMETSHEWIYSRTGIEQRHVVSAETTSDLCARVAMELLETSNYSGEDIDFILIATMTPDYLAPSTACLVQAKIGATQAFAMDISAACSGFIYALATAQKFIQSGLYQRGIVIGGETMSRILDWNDRSTAVLFGDGAAGVLIEQTAGPMQYICEMLQADGQRGMSLTAGEMENNSPFAQTNKEIQRYLTMDGRDIFDFALRNVSKNIVETIAKSPYELAEIDFVLAHQANVRIIDSIAKKTKIPRANYLTNLEAYGNTSAASVPLLLHDSIANGTLTLGSQQKIVLTGFGGGLTWGSILLSL